MNCNTDTVKALRAEIAKRNPSFITNTILIGLLIYLAVFVFHDEFLYWAALLPCISNIMNGFINKTLYRRLDEALRKEKEGFDATDKDGQNNTER